MAIDTVTLELTGEVSLDEFVEQVKRLQNILGELSRAIAPGSTIRWLVDALDAGSALTAYRGVPADGTHLDQVESVVRAYGELGAAVERGDTSTYPPAVVREVRALLAVLNDRVPSLRFETPETDATVWSASTDGQGKAALESREAYGAVEGRVQTLSNRGGLRFTLYDTLHDRAVSCYLAEDVDQERLRDVWGRRAIVEGRIKRDAVTGRPLTIRRVSDVVVRPERETGDYRQARGVLRGVGDGQPSELLIRQLRDA